jgi:hypothetical protein
VTFGFWLLGLPFIAFAYGINVQAREIVRLNSLLEEYRNFKGMCRTFRGGPTDGRFVEVPCTIKQLEELLNAGGGRMIELDRVLYFVPQVAAYTLVFFATNFLLSRLTPKR